MKDNVTIDEMRLIRSAVNDQAARLYKKGFPNQASRLDSVSQKLGDLIESQEVPE